MIPIETLICPHLKRGVNYSVYSNRLCGDTLQDLLSNFCAYINECIKYVNDYTEMVEKIIEWVKNEGLREEVIKQLNVWIDDGTFDQIINQELFGDLSDDIEKLKVEVNKVIADMEKLDTELRHEMQNTLQLVDDKIAELQRSFDETIRELREEMKPFKDLINSTWEYKLMLVYGLKPNGDLYKPLTDFIADINGSNKHGYAYLPKGNYTISQTIQDLNNITLVCHPEAHIYVENTCANGGFLNGIVGKDYVGRSAGSNIVIDGGTWHVEAPRNNQVFGFGLGENITLKNCTFIGNKGFHCSEFSAVKDGSVINCKFIGKNNNFDGQRDVAEAFQIQTQTEAAFPFFGHNPDALNTPCYNLLFKDCYFENFTTGVGSHGSVYGKWDKNITIDNCTFQDISYVGVRAHMWDGCTITNCDFYQCERAIICQGMVKNLELNRPNSLSTQYIHIENNNIINYQNSAESIFIIGAMRDDTEGGLAYSNFVTITNNVIQRKDGIAIRLRFCKQSVVSGNTVRSGQFIRVANSRDTIVSDNNVDCWQDVPISFSRDVVYFTPSNGCIYTTFENNIVHGAGDSICNFSYCFVATIKDNFGKLDGTGERKFITVNSESSKAVVVNNIDYADKPTNTITYECTSGCRECYTGNNLSLGYAHTENTGNYSASGKTMISLWQ